MPYMAVQEHFLEAAGKPGPIPKAPKPPLVRFYGGPWHGETRPDPRKPTWYVRTWTDLAVGNGSEWLDLPVADSLYLRWESAEGHVVYIIEGLDPFAAGKPGQDSIQSGRR